MQAQALPTQEQVEQFLRFQGQCEFFKVEPFLEAANILVASDEPMKALQLLENLPGYYRDHIPTEVVELTRKIHAKLATPAFYMRNVWDERINFERSHEMIDGTVRGTLIYQDVKAINDKGMNPHIIDLGPGEYWLPMALENRGCTFTYEDIGLNAKAKELAEPHIAHLRKDKSIRPASWPTIFVACELIEHLHYEKDIRVEYMRSGGHADIIHISTPRYTYDGRQAQLQWENKGDLGHLRTYTPNEFKRVVTEMFPEFNWGYCEGSIQHLRGEKIKF